jgi:hypothetical protein
MSGLRSRTAVTYAGYYYYYTFTRQRDTSAVALNQLHSF